MAQVTRVPKINFHVDCPAVKNAGGLAMSAVTHAYMNKIVFIYEELDGEQIIMTRDGLWFGDGNPSSYYDHPRRLPAYDRWNAIRSNIPDGQTWVGWSTTAPRTISYAHTHPIIIHLIVNDLEIVSVEKMGKIVKDTLPIVPMQERKSLNISKIGKLAQQVGSYGATPHVRGIIVRNAVSFHRGGWASSIFRFSITNMDMPPSGWFNKQYDLTPATVVA